MTSSLMTVSACWEVGAKVSIEYAINKPSHYYFCPEINCLEKVVPVQGKVNIYFRAPSRHASGCKHEKDVNEDSQVSGTRKIISPATPITIIPNHLGEIPVIRNNSIPLKSQLRALAQTMQDAPAIQPGTLQDVVEAWVNMTLNDRHNYKIEIANQKLSYFSAFTLLGNTVTDIMTTKWNITITSGKAFVEFFNGSFYIKTFSRFSTGGTTAPIRIRVKPGDTYFNQLVHKTTIKIFLHVPTPTLNGNSQFFDIASAMPYSGFIIM